MMHSYPSYKHSSVTSSHSAVQHCTNCGRTDHLFRQCMSPVTSYGMIAIRYQHDSYQTALFSRGQQVPSAYPFVEFLLIKRKDSIAFLEFMRGKYNPHDTAYVGVLLRSMTIDEQDRLLTRTFEELWNTMWGGVSLARSHKSNYELSEKKYMTIRAHLPEWIATHRSIWTEPEWGFPKGRRDLHETDIQCAVREFQEETGLLRSQFTMIQNTTCLSETFFGSNNVHYCHKYYLAICPSHTEVEYKRQDYHMSREIGDIKWCSLDEAIAKIRPDNIEKREILLKAGKIMKNFYPIYPMENTRA